MKTLKHVNKTLKNKTLKNKKKQSIWFYDNQQDIISQFKNSLDKVNVVLVDNNKNNDILKGYHIDSHYTIKFLEKHPENTFAKYLKLKNIKELKCINGFSKKDAKKLKTHILNKETHCKAVIFDWDGTLSVNEGIIVSHDNKLIEEFNKYNIKDEDMAIYYAGGIKRLNWMLKFFKFLQKKNIRVFIITNNPVACCNWKIVPGIGPNSRPHFYNIVSKIIPNIMEKDILCGYESECFKPHTFLNNKYLKELYEKI